MTKKIIAAILLAYLWMSPNLVLESAAMPDITAKSAIVIEALTGKVLYSKNAADRRYPASTTKMMTLIVALERGNLEDIVTASANAAGAEGSTLWLTEGEKLKLIDLLYGVMLVSGNDASIAVAEHIAGSVENFSKLMTEKAHAIGAKRTNFTNPNGLPDDNHYSTAHDLAQIAAYGYRNPLFAKIVSTEHKVIPWPGKDHDRDLYNENKIIWFYEGGNGVKTGYTDAAGRCLVSGAKRNDIQLVAVVLDSERLWEDSMALLDYGFSMVKPMVLFKQGDIVKTIRVVNGESQFVKLITNAAVNVPVTEEDKDSLQTVVEVPAKIEAPVTPGQKVGNVKIMYKQNPIATVELIAAESVEKKSFLKKIWSTVRNFLKFMVHSFA